MREAGFFQTDDMTFGDTKSFISLSPTGYVILPEGLSFSKLDSHIEYSDDPSDNILGEVNYELGGMYAGKTDLILDEPDLSTENAEDILTGTSSKQKITYIDVTKFIPYIVIAVAAIIVLLLIIHIMKVYNIGNAMSRRREIKKRQKRYHSSFDDIDF